MDYDDNDFQSQNLHLAGEGANKFPPVLRPYALTKFDFDDNLHGPLRFDSLVETEVFLGIESNEDNQWIEDFSRGSSGIQFSSTAAEPCSISRRNNVWSEATSSESVEMLLKSVGQEEIIPVQANTRESDACDELGCIIKQMEPNLKQDNATISNVADVQATFLPCGVPENVSILNSVVKQHHPQVENSSPTHKGGTSVDAGASDLTAVGVEVDLPITQGNTLSDDKCSSIDQRDVDDRTQGASASGIQHDCAVTPVQNVTTGNDELNNENVVNHVKQIADDNKTVLEVDTGEDQEEKHVLSQEAQMDDHILHENVGKDGASHLGNPLYSASLEPIKETSMMGTNFNVEEPSCKGDSGSSEDFVIGDHSRIKSHEVSLMGFEGSVTFERNKVDATDSSQLDTKEPDGGVSLLSAENQKDSVEKVDGSGNSYVGDDSNLNVECSSAEVHGEVYDNSHVLSSIASESSQMCGKNMVSGCGDAHKSDKDVPLEEKESSEFPSNGGHVEAATENESTVPALKSDSAADSNSVVIIPVSLGGDITIYNKDAETSPLPVVGLSHLEKEEEIAAKNSPEASSLDLKTCSPVTSRLNLISEMGESTSTGPSGHKLFESANESSSLVGVCNSENQSEPEAAVIQKASQGCTEEMEVSPVLCDSAVHKGDGATELNEENHVKESSKVSDPDINNNEMLGLPMTVEESCLDIGNRGLAVNEAVIKSSEATYEKIPVSSTNECERNTDLDKTVSGSPTVIPAEIPQNGNDKESVKVLSDQAVSVANVSLGDANKVSSISLDPMQNDVSKDERSFTFSVSPVALLPQKETGNKSQPGSTKQKFRKAPLVTDASLSPPVLGQSDPKIAQDLSRGSPKVSDVATRRSGSKGNTERRPRRASGKSTGKETTKKGTPVKETSSLKLEGEKIGNVSLSPSGVSQLMPSNEMHRYGHVDSGGIKPFVLAASTSGLPDLNSSASQSLVFQQPFTDLQQVQLRAQIFVYGALIQGSAPDEAYMISAFGGNDGGRSIWENAWQSCMERLHGQKSHLITPETPLQSRSGVRASDQAIKQNALQSKATPSGRPSGKGTPSSIVSAMLPLSSPLWSIPTPTGDTLQSSGAPRGPVMDYQRALSPLHPHQTPSVRNFVGHSPSWISQAPFGPWVAAPQSSAIDASGRFSVQLPMTEPVQLTPVKEGAPHSSAAKHVTHVPVVHSGVSVGVFSGASPVLDVKKIAASGQSSVDPKPRKRKKTQVSENLGLNILQSQSQTESVPAPAVGGQLYASAAITSPVGFVSKTTAENFTVLASHTASIDVRQGSQNAEHRAILSEETLCKLKEAKAQAEDAAVLAAAAVSHSQEIWSQLDKQRNSGLSPDGETKLASAAVAIAAAAAVAKAAAAAANVASNAALQAKLMADEAIVSGSYGNPSQGNAISVTDGITNLGKATPASILKGDDGTNGSNAILIAAREAARRRVEAASAASKRAENMDAIVKAAELAAEAVSQAGKIVAMGDPLPLGDLVAAGPEGYWKIAQVTSDPVSKSKDVYRDNLNVDCAREGLDTSGRHLKDDSSNKREALITTRRKSLEDHASLIDGLTGSGSVNVKDPKGQKGRKVSDSAKTIGVIPESESGPRSSITGQNTSDNAQETLKEKSIKEGSLVEVFKDGNGFKATWFSANVLSLKDGKAYVSYTELTTAEGLEKLKEWVALNGEGDRAPGIRIARPITAMPFEGTRKRRRAALGEYNWSVGDRVDAWIQDSWWEGVITEKNKKDETVLTVNFPVQGETSVVKAWHLRPSLLWRDGEWVEWSSSKENNCSSHEGDTPQEKRPRVRSPAVEAKGKDKTSTSINVMESNKPDEPTLLELTSDDKIFNIGKSSRDGNKPDVLRMTRTGLQMEGSKVVFGVPKPGKKRKFMEVSKHYVGGRSDKIKEASDSVKFTKFLIPQGTGSRGWKSTSKPELVEKRAATSKSRSVKPGRVQNVSGRTIPQKDNMTTNAISAPDDATTDDFMKTKDSMSLGESTSGKHNLVNFQSFSASEGATDGSVVFSSQPLSDAPSFKRSSTSNAKSERVSKGKLAPAGGKLGRIEEDKVFNANSVKTASDTVEPRRSNRRIQPTSRLLEGLQSSLMVSKIPSVMHEKSHKNRVASRGNNHG